MDRVSAAGIGLSGDEQDDLPPADRALLMKVAVVLFANGQTSEGIRIALARLGHVLGREVLVSAAWGMLTVKVGTARAPEQSFTVPSAVDIGRVVVAERIVDDFCGARLASREALAALDAIDGRPPVSLVRFAVMAGAGAAALGVIFGAANLLTLCWIAVVAGAGACLR